MLVCSGHRVPAIFYWPSVIARGVNTGLASTLDILPTVLGMVGGKEAAVKDIKLDGYDLSDMILNISQPSPRKEFLYIHPSTTNGTIHALRWDQHEVVRHLVLCPVQVWRVQGSLHDPGQHDVGLRQ